MYKVNHKVADRFVAQQQALGVNVSWDGWTMVFFRPEPMGEFSRQGSRGTVDNQPTWGYANKFDMDAEGVYNLDTRNIKFPKKSGNRR